MVVALVKDGKEVDALKAGESGAVVLNQTPFYGESGGQVGDTGALSADGVRFRVTDTQKKAGDVFVHIGTVEEGTLKVGAALALDVDHARRSAIRQNHSATHLLHEALRQVLGDHVAQKGSLVAPDRLRFDFSHPKPMTAEEIEQVEDIANDVVLQNSPVTTRLMALDDARASGARALFGEKYGDEVRVVAMGEAAAGTHHGLVGRAVRRHPCPAHRRHRPDLRAHRQRRGGRRAPDRGADRRDRAQGRAAPGANSLRRRLQNLKCRLKRCPARLAQVMDERRRLERELSDAKKRLAMGGGGKRTAPTACAWSAT